VRGGFRIRSVLPADTLSMIVQPDDLGFKQGDVIQVLEEVNTDWWKGSLRKFRTFVSLILLSSPSTEH